MAAYYNEIDPYAAQWLRNLIAAGHIAPGEVDERSILDVSPDDLTGFIQCHFFAGIGVWSHALRRGGWPDERPAWTGSCPCQPFSVAGVGSGMDDQRHLWPYWFHLIEQRRPAVVFGEQVEAAVRYGWLDLVQADMEGIDYAFAAAGIPAAGVGAPHIRQRLFFVADAMQSRRPERRAFAGNGQTTRGCIAGGLADTDHQRRAGQHALLRAEETGRLARGVSKTAGRGAADRLDDTYNPRLEGLGRGHQAEGGRIGTVRPTTTAGEFSRLVNTMRRGLEERDDGHAPDGRALPSVGTAVRSGACAASPTNGFWRAADWLLCRDGKWRAVEPGTFPLAHGATARVGRLRAYGNAICAPLAAEFVSAFLECRP